MIRLKYFQAVKLETIERDKFSAMYHSSKITAGTINFSEIFSASKKEAIDTQLSKK